MFGKLPLHHAEGNFYEAIELYTKAIELNPTSAVFRSNRAAAHIKIDQHGSAMADAAQAIKLDPKYVKVCLAVPCCASRAPVGLVAHAAIMWNTMQALAARASNQRSNGRALVVSSGRFVMSPPLQ